MQENKPTNQSVLQTNKANHVKTANPTNQYNPNKANLARTENPTNQSNPNKANHARTANPAIHAYQTKQTMQEQQIQLTNLIQKNQPCENTNQLTNLIQTNKVKHVRTANPAT